MNKRVLILSIMVAIGLVLLAIPLIYRSERLLSVPKLQPLLSEPVALPEQPALSSQEITPPPDISENRVVSAAAPPNRAMALFSTNCSGCHGPDGWGSAFAPSLHNPALQQADDTFLYTTIASGRPGTAMPAWGDTLSREEILSLIALLRSWGNSTETPRLAEQEVSPGYGMGTGMMGHRMGQGSAQSGRHRGMKGGPGR